MYRKLGKEEEESLFSFELKQQEILHYLTQNRSKLGFFSCCFFVFIRDEYTRARTHADDIIDFPLE